MHDIRTYVCTYVYVFLFCLLLALFPCTGYPSEESSEAEGDHHADTSGSRTGIQGA